MNTLERRISVEGPLISFEVGRMYRIEKGGETVRRGYKVSRWNMKELKMDLSD